MHKMVNGKKVDLTKEQIKLVRAKEAAAKAEELELQKTAYIEKRKAAYPSIEELVVALWEKDTKKIAEIEAKRQEIKKNIPKGS